MMTTENRIDIPFSKSKMRVMLLGSLAFTAIGIWFVNAPPAIGNTFRGDPARLTVIGYAAIVFFGLCTFHFFRKLQDKQSGLVIDENGILDHAGALAAGRIAWEDIQTITVREVSGQPFILLNVTNPKHYIDREKNLFKQKAMELNHRMYKTPVMISAQGLDIPFGQLVALLKERHEAARKKTEQPSDHPFSGD